MEITTLISQRKSLPGTSGFVERHGMGIEIGPFKKYPSPHMSLSLTKKKLLASVQPEVEGVQRVTLVATFQYCRAERLGITESQGWEGLEQSP